LYHNIGLKTSTQVRLINNFTQNLKTLDTWIISLIRWVILTHTWHINISLLSMRLSVSAIHHHGPLPLPKNIEADLYNRCEILSFHTIASHIKSVTVRPMWFTTYHNGSRTDVTSEWRTTSALVTSVATRCEMSISTDVKCHFCRSGTYGGANACVNWHIAERAITRVIMMLHLHPKF
jgi:hypothetical protein